MKLIMKAALIVFFVCSAVIAQTAIPKGKIHPGIPGDGTSNKFFSVMAYYDPATNQYFYWSPSGSGGAAADYSTVLSNIKANSDTNLIKLNSIIVKQIQLLDRAEKDTTNLNHLANLPTILSQIKADSIKTYGKIFKSDYKTGMTTGIDSLTFATLGLKHWADGDIYSNDTLIYSFDRTFPTGGVAGYAFTGILTPIGKVSVIEHPKIYFKRFGTDGTVNYAYKIRGW